MSQRTEATPLTSRHRCDWSLSCRQCEHLRAGFIFFTHSGSYLQDLFRGDHRDACGLSPFSGL